MILFPLFEQHELYMNSHRDGLTAFLYYVIMVITVIVIAITITVISFFDKMNQFQIVSRTNRI